VGSGLNLSAGIINKPSVPVIASKDEAEIKVSAVKTSVPVVITSKDEIMALIKCLEDTWNGKDTVGFLKNFLKGAQIMAGREQKVVSKEKYERMFPAIFNVGKVKYKVLEIKMVNDSSAIVKAETMLLDNVGILLIRKMGLIYKNKRWMIDESTYRVRIDDDRRQHRGSGEQLDGG